MNFSRYPNRPLTNSSERGNPSNLHDFMEGLSKIAQILYTSLPIIEFLRISSKYSLRFFEFIGSHMLKILGILKVHSSPEVALEKIWNNESWAGLLKKNSSVIALAVIVCCLVFSKPEFEDEWKAQASPKPEVMSVEDKPVEGENYFEEYSGYPMFG
jgi:hypothetical protein